MSRAEFIRSNLNILGFSDNIALYTSIRELLENACDAQAKNIHIHLKQVVDGWILSIKDDGKGVDPEQIPLLIGNVFATSKKKTFMNFQSNEFPMTNAESVTIPSIQSFSGIGQFGVGIKAILLYAQILAMNQNNIKIASKPMILSSACINKERKWQYSVWRVGIDVTNDTTDMQCISNNYSVIDSHFYSSTTANSITESLKQEEQNVRLHPPCDNDGFLRSGTRIVIAFANDIFTLTSLQYLLAYMNRRWLLPNNVNLYLTIQWQNQFTNSIINNEIPTICKPLITPKVNKVVKTNFEEIFTPLSEVIQSFQRNSLKTIPLLEFNVHPFIHIALYTKQDTTTVNPMSNNLILSISHYSTENVGKSQSISFDDTSVILDITSKNFSIPKECITTASVDVSVGTISLRAQVIVAITPHTMNQTNATHDIHFDTIPVAIANAAFLSHYEMAPVYLLNFVQHAPLTSGFATASAIGNTCSISSSILHNIDWNELMGLNLKTMIKNNHLKKHVHPNMKDGNDDMLKKQYRGYNLQKNKASEKLINLVNAEPAGGNIILTSNDFVSPSLPTMKVCFVNGENDYGDSLWATCINNKIDYSRKIPFRAMRIIVDVSTLGFNAPPVAFTNMIKTSVSGVQTAKRMLLADNNQIQSNTEDDTVDIISHAVTDALKASLTQLKKQLPNIFVSPNEARLARLKNVSIPVIASELASIVSIAYGNEPTFDNVETERTLFARKWLQVENIDTLESKENANEKLKDLLKKNLYSTIERTLTVLDELQQQKPQQQEQQQQQGLEEKQNEEFIIDDFATSMPSAKKMKQMNDTTEVLREGYAEYANTQSAINKPKSKILSKKQTQEERNEMKKKMRKIRRKGKICLFPSTDVELNNNQFSIHDDVDNFDIGQKHSWYVTSPNSLSSMSNASTSRHISKQEEDFFPTILEEKTEKFLSSINSEINARENINNISTVDGMNTTLLQTTEATICSTDSELESECFEVDEGVNNQIKSPSQFLQCSEIQNEF